MQKLSMLWHAEPDIALVMIACTWNSLYSIANSRFQEIVVCILLPQFIAVPVLLKLSPSP